MSKKITPIIALSIIGLLAIATIVMAFIPKSYAPAIIEKPDMISVSSMSGQTFIDGVVGDQEVFDNIYTKFRESFTESSINSLFQGRIAINSSYDYTENIVSNISNITPYITLDYNTAITIEVEETQFTFDRVVVQLEESTSLQEVKLYLFAPEENSTGYFIATIGNFTSLLAYIETL